MSIAYPICLLPLRHLQLLYPPALVEAEKVAADQQALLCFSSLLLDSELSSQIYGTIASILFSCSN